MVVSRFAAVAAVAVFLAGCGQDAQFLVEASAPVREVRLRVASLELREVSLPAYAIAADILQEEADGALRPIRKAVWADGSARGVTAGMARSLDLRTSAEVAAEPWPLAEPADARLEVRIERIVARADGTFQLAGQYAVASPEGRIREFIERFDIRVPVTQAGPAAIASANGVAVGQLADAIVARLRG